MTAEPMEPASHQADAAAAQAEDVGEAAAAADERAALTVIGGGNVKTHEMRKGLTPAKRCRCRAVAW